MYANNFVVIELDTADFYLQIVDTIRRIILNFILTFRLNFPEFGCAL